MTIAPLTQIGAPTTATNNEIEHPTVGGSTDIWGQLNNQNFNEVVTKINEIIAAQNNGGGSSGFVVGELKHWIGNISTLAVSFPGWRICDGTNGTPDLRGRTLIGVGSGLTLLASVGAAQAATASAGGHTHNGTQGHELTIGQMPTHSHGVNDAGHTHGYTDESATATSGADDDPDDFLALRNDVAASRTTASATTGITIDSAGSGQAHSHGIGTDGAHTHQVSVMQPSTAVHIIMYFGT